MKTEQITIDPEHLEKTLDNPMYLEWRNMLSRCEFENLIRFFGDEIDERWHPDRIHFFDAYRCYLEDLGLVPVGCELMLKPGAKVWRKDTVAFIDPETGAQHKGEKLTWRHLDQIAPVHF